VVSSGGGARDADHRVHLRHRGSVLPSSVPAEVRRRRARVL